MSLYSILSACSSVSWYEKGKVKAKNAVWVEGKVKTWENDKVNCWSSLL